MHACMKRKVLFLKLIFVGKELLYNVVLVPTVQQNESARNVSPPRWTSSPFSHLSAVSRVPRAM